MAERSCAVCGAKFTAQRRTAMYCSKRCNVRASRSRPKGAAKASEGQVVALRTAPAGPPDDSSAASEQPLPVPTVMETTRAALEAVERLNTPSGAAAMALARRIDYTLVHDTASSIAAAVKQLDVTLKTALAGAEQRQDEVDELQAWKDRIRRAAAGA